MALEDSMDSSQYIDDDDDDDDDWGRVTAPYLMMSTAVPAFGVPYVMMSTGVHAFGVPYIMMSTAVPACHSYSEEPTTADMQRCCYNVSTVFH